MQTEVHKSNWLFNSRIFLKSLRKNPLIMVLITIFFGLNSSNVSAQLNLENFSGGIPATWAINSNQTVTNNWVASTVAEGYSGTPGAKVNPALNTTTGTTAEYFLISPQFTTPNNSEIRFWTKQGSFTNKGTIFQLRLSTATQPDISSFTTVVASWTEAQLNVPATTYQEKIVSLGSLPQGLPVYLAFVAVTNQDASNPSGTSGDIWFIDNIRVIESCSEVTGITSIMSANDGSINWTHPIASNFEIQIVPQGSGIGTTGTPVSGTSFTTGTLTNGTPFTDGTTYDVYIRTVCDATTMSGWAGPYQITTARLGLSCATPVVIPNTVNTTPYVLSTNLNTFHDTQTYTALNSQTLSCQPSGSSQNWLLGDHAFLSYTPTTTGLVNIGMAVNVNSASGCYNALSSAFVFDSCAIGTTANCLGSIITGQPSNVTSGQIQNMLMQAGQTYYFVISSPYQQSASASVCFTFTLSQPSCPTPSGLSYNNLTQTGASFSWDNPQNLVSNWEYIVKEASQGVPNVTDVVTPTATNINNPSMPLTAATSYNLYVRSVCGGTPGTWFGPMNFRTPCNTVALPYCTGFTDSAMNDCWSQINLNNDGDFFHFASDASSEPVAKLRVSNAGSNSNDILVSPQFNFDGVNQKRLRFKYNIYGNWGSASNPNAGPGSFEVKMSTSGIGASNFTTTVVPLASYTTAYNYIEMVVPLPNVTGNVNIAWVIPQGATQTGTWIYIDDVCIENLPNCSEPSYTVVDVSSITTNSAEVSWTNGYNNSQWEVIAQPLGTGTPVAPYVTGAVVNIVTTNPYTIIGLNPSTRYEFYVRAICGVSGNSEWAGPTNFNTLCIAQPTPYVESLNDNDNSTKKFCWTTNNVDNDPARWVINGTEATIQPQPINFFEPFVSYNDWLISVPVNAVGSKRVRFKYRVVTTPFYPAPRGNFEVLMSSTPDFSTYTTLIPAHDFSNPNLLEDFAMFNGTGITYFAFRLPPNMANPSNTGIVVVDDFVVEDAPTCPYPTDLAASNITTNSANLAWNAGYNEIKWEIVVQQSGAGIPTPGTGTTINNTSAYSASNLTPNTGYEYYVRAICSSSDSSEWVGPFSFRTTCVALQTPFIETFDSNSTSEACWTIFNSNNDANEWNLNSTVQPIGGDQMAALFTGSNGDNNDWLVTPTLKAHAGQRLRFSYKVYHSDFQEDLKVLLSTNGTAVNQFSAVLYENNYTTTTDATGVVAGSNTITVTSTELNRIKVGDVMYIPGYPFPYGTTVIAKNGAVITLSANATASQTGNRHVEFKHEIINNMEAREMVINLTGITSPTDINLGFHTPGYPANPWGYRGQLTFIDNVTVEDIPACPSIINLTSGTITDTTAIIDWGVAGTESSWEISVQPFGTPAPAGSTLPQYLQTTTTHPYTITGLAPSTKYQVYVRAICSGSSQSAWVGPIEILTRCDSSNLCQYTISLSNGNTGHVARGINVVQNGIVLQSLTFPIVAPNQPTVLDYQVFLCSGVEFNLYWDGIGSGIQYSQAQAVVKDQSGNIIWTSPLGLGTVNTNIYTGVPICGTISCPQPTNLTLNNNGVLSWTPGGSETKWEVAIQPYANGTIPPSGVVVVNTPSYTPQASDFTAPLAGTNEYFVRAVCGDTNKSYWSGPKVFIRNDEPTTAIQLPVNTNGNCDVKGTKVSFIGATASSVSTSCAGVNGGDVWYEFVATSKVHTVELSGFAPGSYYASSFDGVWPKIMMSLYEVQTDGSLIEKSCSENNSLVTTYSSELTVGKTYKIRLKLNDTTPNVKLFDICVSTPADMCNMNAFNYDFEKLPMQVVTGVSSIIDAKLVPGWRVSTDWGVIFFQEASNSMNVTPYSGGQCLQLSQDSESSWNPSDPNIKGLYKDFDTSEITVMDFSFASATRMTNGAGTTVKLFAGPPSGPFTEVASDHANSLVWELISGNYTIPTGQTTTRFIFRTEGNKIGHIIDAANFKANTRVKNATLTLGCSVTSTLLEAEGIGEWSADASNPAPTTIDTPTIKATNVSGFSIPGVYVYHWITRYCDSTVTITYEGVTELPTVATVNYCSNQTASALTATPPANHTLLWYTQPTGGTGSTTAPIPDTSVVGSVIYYVSAVDANGCIGPRAAIEVIVGAIIVPNVDFNYDKAVFCKIDPNPIITLDTNFTSGGTFSAQPNGLDINAITGEINLSGSSGGVYTITYEILENGCTTAAVNVASVTVDASCVDIPKGISPNNDGSNDVFDLTGLDVRSIVIFNRYGTEVYAFNGNYTTQWGGQSNKGEKLPDGTYFYTITKADGSTATGWVYINK